MSARDERPDAEEVAVAATTAGAASTGPKPPRDPAAVAEAWVVTTETGSRYVVVRDHADVWWFGGDNMPSMWSVALPRGLWRIDPPRPWPPILGSGLVMMAPAGIDRTDPARVPGGGKLTSAVQIVEPLSADAAAAYANGGDDA